MRDVKKVLFVDHAPGLGGAERSLLLLMAGLQSRGWEPHLACTPHGLARAAIDLGIPVHVISLPRLRRSARFAFDLASSARMLALLANKIGARVIYANTVRAAVYSAVASLLSRRALIWHMRDFWLTEDEPANGWVDRLGKQLLIAASARVIANSAAVASELPRSSKLTIVHNGIDLRGFAEVEFGPGFRNLIGSPPGVPVVGMVGRLRPWKGQERFIRIADRIYQQRQDVTFVIVGGSPLSDDDDYATALKAMVDELGLQETVRFSGHLEDVRPALAAMDLFVHPGDPEPFGLVILEAMAMGLPVVAFEHGALPEIVVDGGTGRLVTPADESAMAEKILALLGDSALCSRMGEAGRERVSTYFSIDRTVDRISALLLELTCARA